MNNSLQETGASVVRSVQGLYDRLMAFLPQLVAAVVILIIGWIIAAALGRLVTRALRLIRIDELAERAGMNKMGERMGRRITIAGVLGWLVKWFFLIVTFVTAANALNLTQVSQFLYNEVVPYFGNVIIAVIILAIGYLAGNFLYEIVKDSLRASNFKAAGTLAAIARWSIIIFAVIAALSQLRIASDFMRLLFAAIVFMLALAGGLAFGLGGRDQARDALERMRNVKR